MNTTFYSKCQFYCLIRLMSWGDWNDTSDVWINAIIHYTNENITYFYENYRIIRYIMFLYIKFYFECIVMYSI